MGAKRLTHLTTEERKTRRKGQRSLANKRYHEKLKGTGRLWADRNPEAVKEACRKRYLRTKETVIERAKMYYQENREKILSYQKERNAKKSPEKKLEEAREARQLNPERFRKANRKWQKKKLKEDPLFRLTANLRRRLRFLVHRRTTRMVHLLGCSAAAFRSHLEVQFEPWMNWSNYGFGPGKWVVDHIIPCSRFDLSKVDEQNRCFHYTNLCPLCWRKNNRKSNKIEAL